MIKAVVFDLDDTLISEKQYIQSGYRHVAKILSKKIKLNEIEIFQRMQILLSQSSKNVFNRLLEELNVQYSQNDVLELVEEYRGHSPLIHYYSDVLPCLKNLRKRDIKLGIITDGYAITQRQKLKVLNAYTCFDEIIVTDELGRDYWKPHPCAFEIMKSKMGVEYPEMMYVGDNPEKDFYIRKIYPMVTVRIQRANCIYNDRHFLCDIKALYNINSLNDLTSLIDMYR